MSFNDDDEFQDYNVYKNESNSEQSDNLSELSDDVLPKFVEVTRRLKNEPKKGENQER